MKHSVAHGSSGMPVSAWADDQQLVGKPSLMIAGTGHLTVVPDRAFVTFGMEKAGPSLSHAQRQNNEAMQKVTKRVLELQIEKEQIRRSSFEWAPAPPQITGYVVRSTVTMEVRNTERVAAVSSYPRGRANRTRDLRWALRDEH